METPELATVAAFKASDPLLRLAYICDPLVRAVVDVSERDGYTVPEMMTRLVMEMAARQIEMKSSLEMLSIPLPAARPVVLESKTKKET